MDTATTTAEKRSFKVTNSNQFQVLISLMESNEKLAKCLPASGARERLLLEEAWNNVAREVNSFGPPERTGFEWKKIWADFKSRTKRKVYENKKHSNGEKGFSRIPLTDLEQTVDRILQFSAMPLPDELPVEEFDVVFDDLINSYEVKMETEATASTSQQPQTKTSAKKSKTTKKSKATPQPPVLGKRKFDKMELQFRLLQQQVQTQDKIFKVMRMQAAATKAMAEATNRQAQALATIADSTQAIAKSMEEALKYLKKD
ncbi:uncharacterized protein LOC119614952 [Lucilia sericata]|uniref:uncharacterized protein LOC119614952 n=1 Tax=Lucilia sericata TaxID=13632 RepID=UPI0018A7E997|nr:uncharacterized protein LOC119614952 [Lucilia sericata]